MTQIAMYIARREQLCNFGFFSNRDLIGDMTYSHKRDMYGLGQLQA
jgi:hypothetical protein